jgi:hypothetical protein
MYLQTLMTVHVRWPVKNSGAFVFGCLFLCFFLLGKQKKENISALYRKIFKLTYFLCLEAKKVTKKIQGQTNGSARLSGPTHIKNHYDLKIHLMIVMLGCRACFLLCENSGGSVFRPDIL